MAGAHRVVLPAEPAAEVERALGSRWVVLVLLSASLLLVSMQVTVLTVVMGAITPAVHAGSAGRLLIVDAYPLALAGLLVAAGEIGDRSGRRRVFLFGYAIFALASLGAVFAASGWQLVFCRAGLGAGGAAILPASLAMVRQVFDDPRERAFAFGVWSVVLGVGVAVGPVLGGWLLRVYDWHAVFVINVPLAMVAMLLGRWLLPDYRRVDRRRWDWPGMLLAALALAGVGTVTRVAAQPGPGDPAALVGVVVAVLAGYAFVRRSLRLTAPLLNVRLLARRAPAGAAAVILVAMVGLPGLLLPVAHRLLGDGGLDPWRVAVRLVPLPAALLAGALLGTALAARAALRQLLVGALLVATAGMVVARLSGGYGRLAAALVLAGLGIGASTLAASRLLLASASRRRAGAAAALGESGYTLGTALGMVCLGAVPLAGAAVAAAVLLFVAAFGALILVPAGWRAGAVPAEEDSG